MLRDPSPNRFAGLFAIYNLGSSLEVGLAPEVIDLDTQPAIAAQSILNLYLQANGLEDHDVGDATSDRCKICGPKSRQLQRGQCCDEVSLV